MPETRTYPNMAFHNRFVPNLPSKEIYVLLEKYLKILIISSIIDFQLEDCLKSYNVFETEDEMQKRLDVLRRINALVKAWVRKASIGKVKFNLYF